MLNQHAPKKLHEAKIVELMGETGKAKIIIDDFRTPPK